MLYLVIFFRITPGVSQTKHEFRLVFSMALLRCFQGWKLPNFRFGIPGCQSHRITRSIPNYLLRVVPPLALYNRLPYAADVCCAAAGWRMRIEAGERAHTYTLALTQPHRITINMQYMGLLWTGSFTLSPG